MATYGDVLRVREYRSLLAAATLSDLGDQLTRVALTLLVYQRTGSPLLSAGVFAATYLPSLLGGPVLSSLADRRPAQTVMIGCDVARAYLVLVLALLDPPIWLVLVLLLLIEVCSVPFDAARAAVLPDVLDGDAYVVGTGLFTLQHQVSQVVGFGLAGLVVALLDVRGALAVDALTFAVSAALLARGLRRRAASAVDQGSGLWRTVVEGLDAVRSRPRVRVLLAVAWAGCGTAAVPEALAAFYAASHELPTSTVGLLLGASPAGTALGGAVITRFVPAAVRLRLLLPLLALCALPFLAVAAAPPLPVVLGLLVLSGVGTASLLLASTTIAREVPAAVRGRVYGIASSGLMVSQGLAVLGAGALALVLHVDAVFAVVGVLGLLLTGVVGTAWHRCQAGTVPLVETVSPSAPVPVSAA